MANRLAASRPLFVLSLAWASACVPPKTGDETGQTSAGQTSDGGAVEHEQPCPDPSRAQPPSPELCSPARQIAQVPGECPAPGADWALDKLFSGVAVPSSLARYCRYRWVGAGAPDLSSLPAGVVGQTSPDCRVTAQSPLAGHLSEAFAEAFVQGTQPVPNATATLGPGAPVDIAVVDTAPSRTPMGQAAHGPAIAAIVATLASGCAPGLDDRECRRKVATYLGLPQVVGKGPDPDAGGYFGYQSDLAEGIVAAIHGWTNHDHKLILNLAVGWEPSVGDLDAQGATSHAAVALVRDAIAWAHCLGALTIAASGNQPAGSCVDEPVGPGGWERLPGWNASQCAALGLAPGQIRVDATAPYHPFLYAATALDWGLGNLADFRPRSNAKLATVGFAGAVELAGKPYGPLTGSSVATASLSGIAALLWSYFPTLKPNELMQAIYAGGTARLAGTTPVPATVYLGAAAPEQRVVTACGALAWACSNLGQAPAQCQAAIDDCNTAHASAGVDAGAWWTRFDGSYAQLPASDKLTGAAPAWVTHECQACGAATISRLPTTTPIPAAATGDPWVLPQPETPPCPMCVLRDDDAFLSLADDYASMTLDNVILELFDAAGGAEYLHYGPLPLTPTTVYVLNDAALRIVDRSGLPPQTARVTMVLTDHSAGGPRTITASNEIPVR